MTARIETSPLLATIAAALLLLLVIVDSQAVGAIAPNIADGFGVSRPVVAASTAIYSLFAAAVALGLAAWSDAVRPRAWLGPSALAFALATAAAGAAPHVGVFFVARAAAGVAGGLISALSIAALANASSYQHRGRQMGWVAAAYFVAPVVGVPVATLAAGSIGWRPVFFVVAVLVAGAALLVHNNPLPSLVDHVPDGSRLANPIRSLWNQGGRSRSTRMGVLSAAFVSGGLVGFTAYLGTWLADAFHLGSGSIGLAYGAAGFAAVIGGTLGGVLADRLGKRRVAKAACLAMVPLLLITPTVAWGWALLVTLSALAAAAALRVAPLQALVTELVGARERATYVALRNAASQLGIASGVAVCGRLYETQGLTAVGATCALLTVSAWYTIRRVEAPGEPTTRRPWPLRLLRATASTIIIVTLALPLSLGALLTKARTNPRERGRSDTPAELGVPFEDVAFQTADGVQLRGWILPAAGRGVTIVFTHGLFRSRYELMARAVDLWRRGYSVLLYDLRRHGASNGEFCTLGYAERADVAAAVSLVRGKRPDDRIVLFGISMGAAATLLAAPDVGEVAAIVAESSYRSLSDTTNHHVTLGGFPEIPFGPMLTWSVAGRMGFLPGDCNVESAVARIGAPILFIGGGADIRMPAAETTEPLAAAARHPLSRRVVVAGATHGHAYDTDPGGYVRLVDEFLREAAP